MTRERGGEFGFAPAYDAPIPYLQRVREYYAALGYGAPYEWAHYSEVPFHALNMPSRHASDPRDDQRRAHRDRSRYTA